MTEKNKSIGALWANSGAYGDYFTGSIEIDGVVHKIMIFQNQYKKAENQPDWKIFPKMKKPEEVPKPKTEMPKHPSGQNLLDEDDIPF